MACVSSFSGIHSMCSMSGAFYLLCGGYLFPPRPPDKQGSNFSYLYKLVRYLWTHRLPIDVPRQLRGRAGSRRRAGEVGSLPHLVLVTTTFDGRALRGKIWNGRMKRRKKTGQNNLLDTHLATLWPAFTVCTFLVHFFVLCPICLSLE